MKFKSTLTALAISVLFQVNAAEPLAWERTPGRPAPAQFDAYRGETLEFRCAFVGWHDMVTVTEARPHDTPPFAEGADVRLWYQTNGMGAAWWSVPATVASNTVSATWPPSADPGGERVAFFFGAPSNAYAAAQVRFRNSPGATPNVLDPPSVLDWAAELSAATNALWASSAAAFMPQTNAYTKAETDAAINMATAGIINGDTPVQRALTADLASSTEYLLDTNDGTRYSASDFLPKSGGQLSGGLMVDGNVTASSAISGNEAYLGDTYINGVLSLNNEQISVNSLITTDNISTYIPDTSSFATTNQLAPISGAVNTLWTYVYGETVWIAVTNYMRTVAGVSPSFQLWEVRNGATNCVYWSKEEITNVTADLMYDCKTQMEATVASVTNTFPWSAFQSASGARNPEPTAVTIVSTPTIMLTGGGEWYKTIDTGSSSVWVLKSNGLNTFGGDTNGYFRILDDEGNAQFEIVKTSSYEVDVYVTDTDFDADNNFSVTFNIASSAEPYISAATNLNDIFIQETRSGSSGTINALGITTAWDSNNGYARVTIHQDTRAPQLFLYAKVLQLGENVIRNNAAMDVSGGILCTDGIHKVRPVWDNGTVRWTEVQ